MRSRRTLKASQSIAAIRALQQAVAERQVAIVKAAIREAEARRDASAEQLAEQERSWAAHFAQSRFAPELAQAWAASINVEAGLLTTLESEARRRRGEGERCTAAYRVALAKADAAKDLLKRTARRLRRLREEASLADASDQHMHRGAAS